MEEFRPIPDFPEYAVSNYGRVKTLSRKIRYIHAVTGEEHFRLSTERFLKVHCNGLTGYKFHQLYKNKKMHNKPIHQLVAHAFIPKIKGKDYINHIDGNKHNNVVANLEWCTNEYNHHHATITGLVAKGERVSSSKLTERCVNAIKYFLSKGHSHSELSKAFNISRSNISQISEGKTWAHLTHNQEGV